MIFCIEYLQTDNFFMRNELIKLAVLISLSYNFHYATWLSRLPIIMKFIDGAEFGLRLVRRRTKGPPRRNDNVAYLLIWATVWPQ